MSESIVASIDLGGDSDSAVQSVESLASALDSLATSAETAGQAFPNLESGSAAAASAVETVGSSAETSEAQLSGISSAAEGAAGGLEAAGGAADTAGGQLEEAGHSAENAGSGMEQAEGASATLTGALGALGGEAGGTLVEAFEGLKESAMGLGGEEGLLGLAGSAGALIGVLGALGEEGVGVVDQISRISYITGLSVSETDKLVLAFKDVGSSADILVRLGGMLSTTMGQAADSIQHGHEPSLKARVLMDELGVSIFNANGTLRDQGEVLLDTFNALGNMSDKTEAARLTTELFGNRMAGAVIPVITNFADLMGNTVPAQEAKFGASLDDAKEKSIAYHTEMTNLDIEVERLALATLPLFIPAVHAIGTEVGNVHTVMKIEFNSWKNNFDELITHAKPWGHDLAKDITDGWGEAKDLFNSTTDTILTGVKNLFHKGGGDTAHEFAVGFNEKGEEVHTAVQTVVEQSLSDTWVTAVNAGNRTALGYAQGFSDWIDSGNGNDMIQASIAHAFSGSGAAVAAAMGASVPNQGYGFNTAINPSTQGGGFPQNPQGTALGAANALPGNFAIDFGTGHDAGSSYVSRTGYALVHQGESIGRGVSGGVHVHLHGASFGDKSMSEATLSSIGAGIVRAMRSSGVQVN